MGYNEHENTRQAQEGGTRDMVFYELVTMVDIMDVDERKLGFWVWFKMLGKEGHPTRVITAYQPVRAGKKSLRLVYSQHSIYYKQLG